MKARNALIVFWSVSLLVMMTGTSYSQMNPQHKKHGLWWKVWHRNPDCPECQVVYEAPMERPKVDVTTIKPIPVKPIQAPLPDLQPLKPNNPVVISTTPTQCATCQQEQQNTELITIVDKVEDVIKDSCYEKFLKLDIEKIQNAIRELGCRADNPCSVKAILDKVAKYMGIPAELLYAVTWTESKWSHWGDDGKILSRALKEYGLLQISDWWHKKDAERDSEFLDDKAWAAVVEDPLANAIKGGDILRWSLQYARNFNRKNNKGWSESEIHQAAYSVYNGGPKAVTRFKNSNHRYNKNDISFENSRDNQPWKDLIKDCDKNPEPVVVKPVSNPTPVIVVAEEPKPTTPSQNDPSQQVPQTNPYGLSAQEMHEKENIQRCMTKLKEHIDEIKNFVREHNCKSDEPCLVKMILDKAAQKYDIPQALLYAVAQTESAWSGKDDIFSPRHGQWRLNGNVVSNENKCDKGGKKVVCSTDWGLMQINDYWHKDRTDMGQIKDDVFYNIMYGASLVKSLYEKAKKFNKDKDRNWSAEELYRATYSAYNGGESNLPRFESEKHQNDKNFYKIFTKKPWSTSRHLKNCQGS